MRKVENALEKIHSFALRFESLNGFLPTRKEIFEGIQDITWFNIDKVIPELRRQGKLGLAPHDRGKKVKA